MLLHYPRTAGVVLTIAATVRIFAGPAQPAQPAASAQSAAPAQPAPPALSAIAALEQTVAAADAALRAGNLREADRRYRAIAADGATLLRELALTQAQALIAAGQPEQAVQELDRAHRQTPDDAEVIYALAAGHLRLKQIEAAAGLFDRLAILRPGAETYVLIGRTYRDARVFDRARTALQAALRLNPQARRAHYYLGMVTVMDEGAARLDAAMAEFREELRLTPEDPNANLALGMALVETQQAADALPALTLAVRPASAPASAFLYLGRAQAAVDRQTAAVASFRRALVLARQEAARGAGGDEARLGAIHYQLATALRALGKGDEAAVEFAEAQRVLAERASNTRERLTRYLADIPDPQTAATAPSTNSATNAASHAVGLDTSSRFATLSAAQRADATRRVTEALTGVCFNLGIMQAQASQFAPAADWLARAAALNPAFPQVQFSLGVAWFNARQYDKAVDPLTRALAAEPANATARRMLALAHFNTDAFDAAAALLRDDPQRDADPSLQYIYGVALVRGGHAAEAEATFSKLLQSHSNSPELSVVLGMAYAQQGDHDNAIQALKRALQLKPDVAEANATLGLLYLRQGRLPEASDALRAELKAHPEDVRAAHTLATVLDLDGKPDEALTLLRSVLAAKPDHADARYLLGKILLARGQAADAAEQLEAAVRLAPDEANVHYQLAQAYTKLGKREQAEREFDAYRQLKDKRRERNP